MSQLTLIADGRSLDLPLVREGAALRIPSSAMETALGWKLEPEGICRGDVCVPTSGVPDLVTNSGIDLVALADLLVRPLAIDDDESVASMGASVADQTATLASGTAPDFCLPDLAGREHTLSDYRGKKVLLIAYASW
jgi:hypothetical protein